ACPTDSGFIADQDRTTIAKSSTLPHDSGPRVTSPAAVEGSMQQTIFELTALCTSLQRQLSELIDKFQAQEVKDFRGMTFEEVEAKFNSVWKQIDDFIPMGSKNNFPLPVKKDATARRKVKPLPRRLHRYQKSRRNC
nr:hypothetical protein [Tanacetum cinerariifolium]